jgi:hypothetical protein
MFHCSTGVTTPTPLGPIRFTPVSEQNLSTNQRSFSTNTRQHKPDDGAIHYDVDSFSITQLTMALDFSTHLLASRYQNLPKNVNICYSDLGLNNDPHKNRDPLLSKRPSSHFELAFQPEDNPVKHVPSTAMRLGKNISFTVSCASASKLQSNTSQENSTGPNTTDFPAIKMANAMKARLRKIPQSSSAAITVTTIPAPFIVIVSASVLTSYPVPVSTTTLAPTPLPSVITSIPIPAFPLTVVPAMIPAPLSAFPSIIIVIPIPIPARLSAFPFSRTYNSGMVPILVTTKPNSQIMLCMKSMLLFLFQR